MGPHFNLYNNHEQTQILSGVGSGAAGAALAAPIFWLVALWGPRFLNTRVACFYYQDTEIGISRRSGVIKIPMVR